MSDGAVPDGAGARADDRRDDGLDETVGVAADRVDGARLAPGSAVDGGLGVGPVDPPGVEDRSAWPDRLPVPRTDAPRPTALSGDALPAGGSPADGRTDADWHSWWNLPGRDARRAGRPDPLSDPLEDLDELGVLGDFPPREGPADPSFPAGLGGLAQRTPQASLADELRRGDHDAPAVPPPAPARDALRANSALSRFQANQRAARRGSDGEDRR
jgi:hypothetical protein